ncbi:MAG: trypsin-like peptidase domain-containing protein [FCB group bacterium]|nr:trypsin-like peptidase domain-containing protein [FCB group bacterium]
MLSRIYIHKVLNRTKYLLLFLLVACTRLVTVSHPATGDGRYDSEFPFLNASSELEGISNSLRKINATVYYKTYVFDKSHQLTVSALPTADLENTSVSTLFTNSSTYGTATIISATANKIALLTCAHIIIAPDTVLSYFSAPRRDAEEFIQSVSVKVRQQYYINDLPEGDNLEILALDENADIALLGKSFFNAPDVKVFNFPLGKSSDLEWGTFVYLLGFPMGKKMVTRGLVSKSEGSLKDEFLVDALFNRGSSGGIILAVRDGVPNFELVGLTKAVSSRTEYILTPADSLKDVFINTNLPYTDEVHMTVQKNINYGITYTVPAAAIKRFFKVHQREFKQAGYDFSRFTR